MECNGISLRSHYNPVMHVGWQKWYQAVFWLHQRHHRRKAGLGFFCFHSFLLKGREHGSQLFEKFGTSQDIQKHVENTLCL